MVHHEQLEELEEINICQKLRIEKLEKELDWALRSELQSPLIKNYYTKKLGISKITDGSLLGTIIFWVLILGIVLCKSMIC
jgi:hypothetical protein